MASWLAPLELHVGVRCSVRRGRVRGTRERRKLAALMTALLLGLRRHATDGELRRMAVRLANQSKSGIEVTLATLVDGSVSMMQHRFSQCVIFAIVQHSGNYRDFSDLQARPTRRRSRG